MDCRAVEEKLSAYLDGQLPAGELKLIAMHLNECSACRAELSSLERTVELVSSLEAPTAPPELVTRIMARVNEVAGAQTAGRTGRMRSQTLVQRALERFRSWRLSGVAAVAVVLLLAVVVGRGPINKGLQKGDFLAPMERAPQAAEQQSAANMAQMPAPGAVQAPLLEREMVGTAGESPQERGPAEMKAAVGFAPERAAGYDVKKAETLERKVIHSAHLSLTVEDLDTASERLSSLVQEVGGFIQNSNLSRGENWRSANYTLRVPAPAFSDLLNKVQELGELEKRDISGQDVTEEYVDLDARRRNLERQEQRLLDILSQAKTVDDILKVESHLERVRGEIESLTGRLKFLDDRVGLATLDVVLTERPQPVSVVRPFSIASLGLRLRHAVTASINALLAYLEKGLILVATALPFLVVGVLVGALGWWCERRWKRKPR